ncbi:MAG TPA: hypothetical protein DD670_18190, partial [Planctomycetaceae bacterium]|nr:hypothetical protein [Planctomycetaceae bacterium]
MGHLLDALKQIEDRAPVRHPTQSATVGSSAPVEQSARVESAPRAESSAEVGPLASLEAAFEAVEEACAAENVFAVLGEPCAVEDAFAVADRPRAEDEARPSPPFGKSLAARGATVPVDPRYRELLGAILARMNVRGDMVLLMAGLDEDERRGGQLAAFYPLLGSRIEGGILVVDADHRNAGVTRLLEPLPNTGLRDVLAGNVSWQNAIRETRH